MSGGSDAEREARPFYRDDDEQFSPREVDNESLILWGLQASSAIRHIKPGGINWPMIVRSLISEITKLRAENARLCKIHQDFIAELNGHPIGTRLGITRILMILDEVAASAALSSEPQATIDAGETP